MVKVSEKIHFLSPRRTCGVPRVQRHAARDVVRDALRPGIARAALLVREVRAQALAPAPANGNTNGSENDLSPYKSTF